jgi:hypothetical protein
MTSQRAIWVVPAVVLAGAVALWAFGPRLRVNTLPAHFPADGQSQNLPADLKLMWETEPLSGTPDPTHGPNPRASTDRAINAASRVFNTVELAGKRKDEVVALLGDPKTSSDSIYNFPFWPAPRGALVYRFDCGAYGWQFNVVFGLRGRVTEVERQWIH